MSHPSYDYHEHDPEPGSGMTGFAAIKYTAIVVIVLGGTVLGPILAPLGIYGLPLAAFFGGLVTTFILYRVATRRSQTSIATMLLAGIALAAMTGAFSGVLIYLADDRQLRDLTFWGLGSLAGATWQKIGAAGPIMVAALAATPFLARGLNALALVEPTAGGEALRLPA